MHNMDKLIDFFGVGPLSLCLCLVSERRCLHPTLDSQQMYLYFKNFNVVGLRLISVLWTVTYSPA
jgi:hypothetical protein